jgi:peptidoglycan hydrolase-like protein with peptidoglycan-binding domain
LKLFKKETQKMSSSIWKGLLAIAVIIPTLAIGSQALADLRLGDRGDAVRNLQEKLNISADGIYGQNTEDAVLLYQADQGLTRDGIAGEETLRSLGLDPNSRGEVFFRAADSGSSDGPYRVVIPGNDEDDLSRARQVIGGAEISSDSRRGDYIDAGGYATRSDADEVARQLQDRNLDARVDFRRD